MSSRRPAAGRSTRLNIVEQSLNDSLERLRELRARVEGYQRTHRAWSLRPPTEEQRAALVKLVLELNVDVMALARGNKKGE
jgi:hypothetical protein